MKKIIILALVAATVAVFACFAFAGCGAEFVGNTDLQMNKKYIYTKSVNRINDKQSYYVFYSNGTGKYREYSQTADGDVLNLDYTVTFKYTFADTDKSAVVCFFDSVEYGKANGSYEVYTTWTRLVTVSGNVLCWAGTYGYSFYINEDYLNSTLTNFGK